MNNKFIEPKVPETVKNEKVLTSKRQVTLLSLMKVAEEMAAMQWPVASRVVMIYTGHCMQKR